MAAHYTGLKDFMLSSEIDLVELHTEQSESISGVLYHVVYEGQDNPTPILNNELDVTTYNYEEGVALLYNMRDTLEQYMRANGLVYVNLKIQYFIGFIPGTGSSFGSYIEMTKYFSVLYCDQEVENIDDYLKNNFLNGGKNKVLSSTMPFKLYYILTEAEDIHIEVFCWKGSQKKKMTYDDTVTADEKFRSYELDLNNFSDIEPSEVSMVTVTIGNRCFTAFYSDHVPTCRFYYRNMFNALDYIALDAVTNHKRAVKRSEACVGGITSFYDENTTDTFEVEAEVYDKQVAENIADMIMSKEVRLVTSATESDPSTCPRVLISDEDIEISDELSKSSTLKFTYRYPYPVKRNLSTEQST